MRQRAEEARFRWRREVAQLERPEHLASALTIHRVVRAEARGFFRGDSEAYARVRWGAPREAPEIKAELAALATALKQASDAVWNRKQTLLEKLQAQRKADMEELRELAATEFGVDLEVDLEEERVEADEAGADLQHIEELRARRAG